MRAFLYIALLVAPVGRSWADDPPGVTQGGAVDTDEEKAVRELAKRLQQDGQARNALIQRILGSSLVSRIAQGENRMETFTEANNWILEHPIDAARLGYGFAQDDANNTREFERSLSRRIERLFELNPQRYKGILGRLDLAGKESKKVKLDFKLPEEDQREMLKNLFEGRTSVDGTLTGPGKQGAQNVKGLATFAGSSVYDRLSVANPTGYSPFVQAYQSQLNQRRAPGAPKLLETGKLDKLTLLQPFYELNYDVERLDNNWVYQKSWTLASALRQTGKYSDQQLHHRATLEALEKMNAGPVSPRFERRRRALDEAAKAAREFKEYAELAADKKKITKEFLQELGRRQKNAARWITAASLHEDLQRLEQYANFWSVALRDQINACPAAESAKTAYLAQGDKLDARAKLAIKLETEALAGLESDGYVELLGPLDKKITEAKHVRAGLEGEIDVLANVPHRLLEAYKPLPWWRLLVDRWVTRLAPASGWAKSSKAQAEALEKLLDAFGKVAAGDYAGAKQAAS